MMLPTQSVSVAAPFRLNQAVPAQENRTIEFKEVTSRDPASTIIDTVEDYVVAFLNGEGGRILWGIRDSDRCVVGVALDATSRDRVRKGIAGKIHIIKPAIDPSCYALEFHSIADTPSADLCVVEVVINATPTSEPFFNHRDEAFVRIEGVSRCASAGSSVITKMQSRDAAEVARWCRHYGARVVAIDAPCRWRVDGQPARACERELAADRISCFSTPTEEKARGRVFYTWMFAGHELYAAPAATHPVWGGSAVSSRVAIETFPQAVACALAGQIVSAKSKFAVRRELLTRSGLDVSSLKSIDEVDAALCALTAVRFAAGTFKAHGDAPGGLIIVPNTPLPAPTGLALARWQEISAPRKLPPSPKAAVCRRSSVSSRVSHPANADNSAPARASGRSTGSPVA